MSDQLVSGPLSPEIRPLHLSLFRRRAPILLFFATVGLLFIGWGSWQEYSEYRFTKLVKELSAQRVKVSFVPRIPEWVRKYVKYEWRDFFEVREWYAELIGDKVTSDTFTKLARIPNIFWLTFHQTDQLNDDSLSLLAQFTYLRYAGFDRVPITDQGLRHFEKLNQLETVSLSECAITDEGLLYLRSLKHIRTIQVRDVKLESMRLAATDATGPSGSPTLTIGDLVTMKCSFKMTLPLTGPVVGYFDGNSADGAQRLHVAGTLKSDGKGYYTMTGTATQPLTASGGFKMYTVVVIPGPPDICISLGHPVFTVMTR